MKAVVVPVTPYAQNCSIVWCEETMKGAVTDPGGDVEIIQKAIVDQGVSVEKILLTHGHLDHAGGTAELAERLGVAVEGPHKDDQFLVDELDEHSTKLGFESSRSFKPTRWLNDGDVVCFGKSFLAVHHCPGHTPGHLVFSSAKDKVAFVGDVLFRGSIGRSDFTYGNHAALVSSIREKLWPLGNEITFVPGHGPLSTFGRERKSNPFVSDDQFG